MINLQHVVAAVEVAYKILAARLLAFLALAMTFGLFCWAMAVGTWLHFAIAGAFGVAIFLPVLWGTFPKGASNETPGSQQGPPG